MAKAAELVGVQLSPEEAGTILPYEAKFAREPETNSMSRMIRVPFQNRKRPIHLLQQHHPRQFMGQGHLAQRHHKIGVAEKLRGKAICRTNREHQRRKQAAEPIGNPDGNDAGHGHTESVQPVDHLNLTPAPWQA